MLTDTHCHLDFDVYDEDRDQVVARAKSTGVARMLNPGVDLETSKAAVALAERSPEIYAAVGIHPNSASEWNSHTLTELRALARHPKVVAIGEIGLDYYRDRVARNVQIDVFVQQLSLAAELDLPVVIHNRQASEELLEILAQRFDGKTGVLHSYSDTMDVAEKALSLGFFLGINGPITFRNARGLQEVVALLPLEKLLLETDAPFLTPHPQRGQRNEPANVVKIAEQIALLKGISLQTVIEITSANADRLFHWRENF